MNRTVQKKCTVRFKVCGVQDVLTENLDLDIKLNNWKNLLEKE